METGTYPFCAWKKAQELADASFASHGELQVLLAWSKCSMSPRLCGERFSLGLSVADLDDPPDE
jgi:hypothetical protein